MFGTCTCSGDGQFSRPHSIFIKEDVTYVADCVVTTRGQKFGHKLSGPVLFIVYH